MKRLFIGLLLLISFTSCIEPNNAVEQTKVDTEMSVDGRSLRIFKYEFEGHLYQYHKVGYSKYATGGPIHDPNCPCFYEKDSVDNTSSDNYGM